MRKLSLTELQRLSPEVYASQPKTPVRLILDNVRSALNVGSAFRTADAFALEHIYLTGITAQPPHREILKTALGATDTVAWTYVESTEALVQQLQTEGVVVFAVEQAEGSIALQQFQPPSGQPLALVFGNEVKGVTDSIMPLVDGAIEIEQYGTKHSLNISVCLGIVVWQCFSKLRF